MSHTSSACLSDDEILALIMGQGGEEESSRIEEHLDSCPSCFDLVSTAAQNLTTTWPPVRPDEPVPAKREHLSQLTLVRRQVVGDRYEILGILGVGGMSIVYLAFDPVLDRQVALKILRRDRLTLDTSVRQQLIREARTVSKLSHPNVVVVFDVGNFENEVFIVLEYIDGQTARDYLTTNSRSLREIVDLYLGASRGLIAAHAAQIVHRDFKPKSRRPSQTAPQPTDRPHSHELGRFERVDVDRLAPRYPALPQVLAKGWQGSQAALMPRRH